MHEFAIRLCQINRVLKKTDEFVLKKLGPNKSFSHATKWSDKPRSGARWTDAENAEFLQLVKAERVLEPRALSMIAWHHGRTGNACYEQLRKLKYWQHGIVLGNELK